MSQTSTSTFGRIIRAVGAEALSQVLNVAIRLLLVPLFISTWGAPIYGHWLTLVSVAAWISLADLGGQLYFVNRLTAAWAAQELIHFQELLSTGLALFIVSSLTMFFIVLLCILTMPIPQWLDIQLLSPSVIESVLILIAFKFTISLPIGILLGVFRATGAQATSVMFVNLMLIIQFLGSALALLTKQGIVVLASLEVLPVLIVTAIVIVSLKKRLPKEIEIFNFKHTRKAILKDAIVPSFHFLGIQFSQAIIIQGCVLVTARTLGPIEVVAFSSMRTVANVLAQVLAMLAHSAWPEFTKLDKTNETSKLNYLFKTILLLSLLSGVIYLAILHNIGSALFNWWLKGSVHYEPIAMFLLSSFVIINTLWTLGGNLLMSTNNHSSYARLQLPVNAFTLGAFFVGSKWFGLIGSASALLIGQSLLMTFFVVRLLRKYQWHENAMELLIFSALSLILLPMTLNNWTGFIAIGSMALVILKHLQNKNELFT